MTNKPMKFDENGIFASDSKLSEIALRVLSRRSVSGNFAVSGSASGMSLDSMTVDSGGSGTSATVTDLDRLGYTTHKRHMTDTTFNGWANYETWNASLYINNDEPMYRLAVAYVEQARRFGQAIKFDSLIPALEYNFGQMTPDGVRWMDGRIDTDEMDEMLAELA